MDLIFNMSILMIYYQSDLNFDQFDLNFVHIVYVLLLRPVRVYGDEGVFIFFTKFSL